MIPIKKIQKYFHLIVSHEVIIIYMLFIYSLYYLIAQAKRRSNKDKNRYLFYCMVAPRYYLFIKIVTWRLNAMETSKDLQVSQDNIWRDLLSQIKPD